MTRDTAGASTLLGTILGLIAGMVIGGLVYSWWSNRPPEPAAAAADPHGQHAAPNMVVISEEAQRTAGIRAREVALRSLDTVLGVTGVVASDLNRVAHLRPLARGLVERVLVRFGDRVAAGDALIGYDNVELGLAIGEFLRTQAELERTQTDLEVKRQILARSEQMLKVGAVARTTHDIRAAELKDSEAKVRSARAAVSIIEEQLHRFGLDDPEIHGLTGDDNSEYHRTASYSVLRAPLAGIITGYNVAEGELVNPTDQLLTITDISSVWVLADVYEKDLASVRVDQPVRIRVASYPGEVFHANITYIGDVIDPTTRTVKVRCVVANPSHRLKLDMFATVDIPTSQRSDIPAIPAESLQTVDGRETVFVLESDTEFRQQVVRTGAESDGWIEVLEGVEAGDRIVTGGSFYLKSAFLRELIGGHDH
jgi:membrane fusion protein, heavy metal efflux system